MIRRREGKGEGYMKKSNSVVLLERLKCAYTYVCTDRYIFYPGALSVLSQILCFDDNVRCTKTRTYQLKLTFIKWRDKLFRVIPNLSIIPIN